MTGAEMMVLGVGLGLVIAAAWRRGLQWQRRREADRFWAQFAVNLERARAVPAVMPSIFDDAEGRN